MTRGRGGASERAARGPAPSPDAAPLVRGDWCVRPRDEWGDRRGGAGNGPGAEVGAWVEVPGQAGVLRAPGCQGKSLAPGDGLVHARRGCGSPPCADA